MFFNELNETLSEAVNSYENLIVIGDLNVDVSDPVKDGNDYLSDFVETFTLSNLINRKTCHKNVSGTTTNILTNKPHFFQKTSTVVTGLDYFMSKMIISCQKTTFKKIPPKKLYSEITKNLTNKIFYTIMIIK